LPPSPTRSPDAGFVWWQSLLVAALVVVALIMASGVAVVVLIVGGFASLTAFQTMSWQSMAVQMAGYAGVIAVLAPSLPALASRSWRALGLRALRRRDVLYALGGAVVMVSATAATGAVQQSVFHLKADQVAVHLLRAARGAAVWNFVFLACVAAPVFEELTFRGLVLNALRRYLPAWAAIVLSAAVFGAAHWLPGNNGVVAPLAVGGIVLAFVYYRTGSLIASMLTHAMFNTVTVVFVLGFHQT
jgi:hypothetical protein